MALDTRLYCNLTKTKDPVDLTGLSEPFKHTLLDRAASTKGTAPCTPYYVGVHVEAVMRTTRRSKETSTKWQERQRRWR